MPTRQILTQNQETQSHSGTHSLSHAVAQSLSHSVVHTHSVPPSLRSSVPPSLRHSVPPSLRNSVAHSLSYFSHSVSQSRRRSVTHSRTHARTHSLTLTYEDDSTYTTALAESRSHDRSPATVSALPQYSPACPRTPHAHTGLVTGRAHESSIHKLPTNVTMRGQMPRDFVSCVRAYTSLTQQQDRLTGLERIHTNLSCNTSRNTSRRSHKCVANLYIH